MADVHNQNSLLSLLSMYCHLPVRLWMYIFLIWFPSSSQTTTKMYDPLPVFASLIILHHENITELYDVFMLYMFNVFIKRYSIVSSLLGFAVER